MVGLVCRVGQAEANVREADMERVHVEIEQLVEEGLESSVEVDGIIERKHFFRVEVSVVMFKHGTEKVCNCMANLNHRCILRYQLLYNALQFQLPTFFDVEQCLQ